MQVFERFSYKNKILCLTTKTKGERKYEPIKTKQTIGKDGIVGIPIESRTNYLTNGRLFIVVPLFLLNDKTTMFKFNLFNCQFQAVQLSLGRKCCLSGREALAEVMDKDFQEVRRNFLSDPDLNAHYHHELIIERKGYTYWIHFAVRPFGNRRRTNYKR